MNYWTSLSIDYANQRNYLDELFRVYPTIPEGIREIDKKKWKEIEDSFNKKDNIRLIQNLLKLKLFPIKDSYIAYLKKDNSAIFRNPETVNRLCGRLYDIGLNELYEKCTEPKETNRQIGPLFHRWLEKKSLGVDFLEERDFLSTKSNAVLKGSDNQLMNFANKYLDYNGTKGLDFLARFNGRYIIGEAKFLTDDGGHQNAQFEDAKNLLRNKTDKAIKIAILDGVIYIKSNRKMYKYLKEHGEKYNILSSLLLREFLYNI